MVNSRWKTFVRAVLVTTVLAIPIVAQSSVAGAVAARAAGATSASSYPRPTLAPTSVTAGASTTVSGSDCDPSFGPTNIFVSLVDKSGNVLTSTSTSPNPDGTWQVLVTVPPTAPSGAYGIYSTCDTYYTEFYYPAASLTVTAASASVWAVQKTINHNGPSGSTNGISCTSATACTAVGTYVNTSGQTVPLVQLWNGSTWVGSALPTLASANAYGLTAVSCTGSSSCVAVGDYVSTAGRQLTFAEVWNGSSWSTRLPVNPTGGSADALTGVSCTGPTACTAVGSYDTYVAGSLQSVGLAETWNGTTWSQQVVPEPATDAAFALASVSCTGTGTCVAVGSYTSNPYSFYGSTPLAELWNGTTWSAQSLAAPADAYPSSESVTSVSCSAAAACTAVGSYDSATDGEIPLIERWNGSAWSTESAQLPLDAYLATFSSVDCTGANVCEAVGSYYSASGDDALIEKWNGAAWSGQSAPTPTGATEETLTDISCSSATTCSSLGSYGTTGTYPSGFQQSWSATLAGGLWTAKLVPTLTGTGFDQLQSVSCSSGARCTAVGATESSQGQEIPLAEGWNGNGWTAQAVPLAKGSRNESLSGIACPSTNECISVGSSYTATYRQQAVLEVWNGTAWSSRTVATPTSAYDSELTAVSCSATTACTAVGSYLSKQTFQTMPFAERWNGSTWSGVALALPTGVSSGQLLSISCTAANSCVAVGADGGGFGIDTLLVETWNGSSWTPETLANAAAYAANLSSVSCSTPSSCVAVGSEYGANTGVETPVAEVWNGTTWAAQTPSADGRGEILAGISCTSATSCSAVGSTQVYGYPSQVPLVESWNGSTWTEQAMPKLPDAASGELSSVSCVSGVACAAVGSRSLGNRTTLGEGEGGA